MPETRLICCPDGSSLFTEARGDPAHPALVLVMGATASMLWWPESLCDGLARQGRYVIRYDHRDTGQSSTAPPGPPPYTVEDMAADICSVIEGYGLTCADVMGMSLGAYLAQIAALTRPDLIRSLILFAAEPLGWTGPPLPGMSDAVLSHFAQLQAVDWTDAAQVTAFQLGLARICAGTGAVFDESASAARIAAEMARSPHLQAAFNHAMLSGQADWSDRARDIRQPVLVVHGADDPVLPLPNAQALARTIPGARMAVLNGVGHELPERAMAPLLAVLNGFPA